MTKKELDGLLAQYKAHVYGYESACSGEEVLEHEKGMQEVSAKIWANMEHNPMPLSIDDLVSEHGKEVVKAWLKAMLD